MREREGGREEERKREGKKQTALELIFQDKLLFNMTAAQAERIVGLQSLVKWRGEKSGAPSLLPSHPIIH